MVGGNPVRANVTRRNSINLSARGLGTNPFASNLARIKISLGLIAQARLRTPGKADWHGARKAHPRSREGARWGWAFRHAPSAANIHTHNPSPTTVTKHLRDIGPTVCFT